MGVRRRPAGVPHDGCGVGKTDRVAERHAEARLEVVACDERGSGARGDLRSHQGRPSGSDVRGGSVRLVMRSIAAAALAAPCARPRAAPPARPPPPAPPPGPPPPPPPIPPPPCPPPPPAAPV